ncbi:glycoside hydrolase family 30 protein [Paenibacillus alkalitolerans]|uniref:glycoside hydrolase family 30 protein n=1 Tax=Paenibacillus alkalitolerans TaxID=2799335 RepID=UPI001F39A20B|nr:glycoside hydrolase [Paenibacillus alkalitolerans]
MIKKGFLLIICLILCTGSFFVSLGNTAVHADTPTSTSTSIPTSVIDWNAVRQTVDGFGGSGAFGRPDFIMQLEEPIRTQILDMVFSKDKGIGISIIRNLVGDGVAAPTIEPQPGVFVWDDPDWETKRADFDKGQIWFMNEAKKRGVTTFMSTVWSPPAWMKTNNSVNGISDGVQGKLKPEHYQDFADYLAEYVLGYKKYFDIDIKYISVANEPNWPASYSGCIWTPEELNVFIRDYLGPTFKAKNVPAKIMMPETLDFSEAYAIPALNDPVTVDYIGVVAAHAYGSAGISPFPVSTEKKKPIWMTEFGTGNVVISYDGGTMKDGLTQANMISDMFNTTGISAFFWWWLAARNESDGSDLIRLVHDDSGQVNG